ncbi:MAG: tetratricopeptide repeat protein [Candidatus Obscuribacterales bacterium]|jgi:tetratricopeptide (TPR) repeat protein
MNNSTPIAALNSVLSAASARFGAINLFAVACIGFYISAAVIYPVSNTKHWIQEGISFQRISQFELAEKYFKDAYSSSYYCLNGEKYRELCLHRLAEIYESTDQFEKAESALKAHMAIHTNSGCSHCVAMVKDQRDLARVLSKDGKLGEANAVFDSLFEKVVAHSPGATIFLAANSVSVNTLEPNSFDANSLDANFRVFTRDSRDNSRQPDQDNFIIQANPMSCRAHKNCEHDAEAISQKKFAYLLF